jgi:hypothetical protein
MAGRKRATYIAVCFSFLIFIGARRLSGRFFIGRSGSRVRRHADSGCRQGKRQSSIWRERRVPYRGTARQARCPVRTNADENRSCTSEKMK